MKPLTLLEEKIGKPSYSTFAYVSESLVATHFFHQDDRCWLLRWKCGQLMSLKESKNNEVDPTRSYLFFCLECRNAHMPLFSSFQRNQGKNDVPL